MIIEENVKHVNPLPTAEGLSPLLINYRHFYFSKCTRGQYPPNKARVFLECCSYHTIEMGQRSCFGCHLLIWRQKI